MRAAIAPAVFLAVLCACAAPAASSSERAPESRAALARPETDPALLETPQGAPEVLPFDQVAVRLRRTGDGRLTIVEFLSPGLPEADQLALRLAFEEGKLQPAADGAGGQESWITTLRPSRAR